MRQFPVSYWATGLHSIIFNINSWKEMAYIPSSFCAYEGHSGASSYPPARYFWYQDNLHALRKSILIMPQKFTPITGTIPHRLKRTTTWMSQMPKDFHFRLTQYELYFLRFKMVSSVDDIFRSTQHDSYYHWSLNCESRSLYKIFGSDFP